MYKVNFEYEDFDGKKASAELHFNVTKAEMIRFLARYPQGIEKRLEELRVVDNVSETLAFCEEMILMGYGKRVETDDGVRFVKTPEVLEAFKTSGVYDEFLIHLMVDEGAIQEFILATFPDMNEFAQKFDGANTVAVSVI